MTEIKENRNLDVNFDSFRVWTTGICTNNKISVTDSGRLDARHRLLIHFYSNSIYWIEILINFRLDELQPTEWTYPNMNSSRVNEKLQLTEWIHTNIISTVYLPWNSDKRRFALHLHGSFVQSERLIRIICCPNIMQRRCVMTRQKKLKFLDGGARELNN